VGAKKGANIFLLALSVTQTRQFFFKLCSRKTGVQQRPRQVTEYFPAENGEYPRGITQFSSQCALWENI